MTLPTHNACVGRLEDVPTMTNASWRLINWLSEYAELMLMLRSEASKIFCAMAQMYELYLLHVFYTFSSFNLADIVVQEQQQQVGQTLVPAVPCILWFLLCA